MEAHEPAWAVVFAVLAPAVGWLAALGYYAALGSPWVALLLLPAVALSIAGSLRRSTAPRPHTGETRQLYPLD
jgi:hypothetical protein